MGLLEMFIGGIVGSYMSAKEEQKRNEELERERKNEELEREIEAGFDELERLLSSQESEPSYLDEFVEDMKSDIEYLCTLYHIEPFNQHFLPIFLYFFSFDIEPTEDQIVFLDRIIQECPFSIIVRNPEPCDYPYSIMNFKSYNDCFKDNKLIGEILCACTPNHNLYIWDEIFQNIEPYELDLLKFYIRNYSWRFRNLTSLNKQDKNTVPYEYASPLAVDYPENFMIEANLSRIDFAYEQFLLNK